MLNFKFLGINFKVSVGFLGLITLMLYIDKSGLMLPTMLASVAHELGHLIWLLIMKSKPKQIILRLGAVTIAANFSLTKRSEIFLNLAGPILNLIFFFVFWGFNLAVDGLFFANFALINLILCIFNLLPVTGLDGGGVIYLLLCYKFSLKTTNHLCLLTTIITACLILILGINVFYSTKTNISLILLALYLFLGVLISKKQKNYCNIY